MYLNQLQQILGHNHNRQEDEQDKQTLMKQQWAKPDNHVDIFYKKKKFTLRKKPNEIDLHRNNEMNCMKIGPLLI